MRTRRADWVVNDKIHNRNNSFFRAYKAANELELPYDTFMKDCTKNRRTYIYIYVWSLIKSRGKQKVICRELRELRVNEITYSEDNGICESWTDNL